VNIKSICINVFVNIKRIFLPPIGYRKISKIFNDEGLKIPGLAVSINKDGGNIYQDYFVIIPLC